MNIEQTVWTARGAKLKRQIMHRHTVRGFHLGAIHDKGWLVLVCWNDMGWMIVRPIRKCIEVR